MKTVMQFLSLLLCLELIIGPVRGSLLISSAMAQEEEDQTCPAGQNWDNSVNRCLTKAEVIKVNNATQACGADKDCYKRNGMNEFNTTSEGKDSNSKFEDDGSGKQNGIVTAGSAVAIAVPLVVITGVLVEKYKSKGKENKFTCKPNSLLLMYAAGAALATGEIYGYINHGNKLREIKQKWDETVMPKADDSAEIKKEKATEAQSQAFEFLAQNEDQVAKTTKTKKGFYLAATGLFAAGAAAAVVEQIQATLLQKPGMGIYSPDQITRSAAQAQLAKLTCNEDNEKASAELEKDITEEKNKELKEFNEAEDTKIKNRNEEVDKYKKERLALENEKQKVIDDEAAKQKELGDKYKPNKELLDKNLATKQEEIEKLDTKIKENLNKEIENNKTRHSSLAEKLKTTTDPDLKVKIQREMTALNNQDVAIKNNLNQVNTISANNSSNINQVIEKNQSDIKSNTASTGTTGEVNSEGKKEVKKDPEASSGSGKKKEQSSGETPEEAYEHKRATSEYVQTNKEIASIDAKIKQVRAEIKASEAYLDSWLNKLGGSDSRYYSEKSTLQNSRTRLEGLQNQRNSIVHRHNEAARTIKRLNSKYPKKSFNNLFGPNKFKKYVFGIGQNTLGARSLAIHNISGAKTTSDLLNLMNELESLGSETASHSSYIQDDLNITLGSKKIEPFVAEAISKTLYNDALSTDLKAVELENYTKQQEIVEVKTPISLSQLAQNAFIPNSHAKFDLMKIGGGALSAVGVIKQVLGGITTIDDKPVSAQELKKIKVAAQTKMMKAISKPKTRIAINGVLMGWMGLMTIHMNKQQKLSEARARKLRSMQEDFKGGTGLTMCTTEERADPSQPNCYCYTADNKINPARASNSVCKNTLVKLEGTKVYATNKDNTKICVNKNMDTDPTCACRATNSCLKPTSQLITTGFSPNTFKMISAGSAPASDLFNGVTSGADITDSAGVNAARISAAAKDLLAKTDPKAAKEVSDMSKGLEKALIADSAGMKMGGLGSSGAAALPSSPAAAAAALDKELDDKDSGEIEVTTSGDTSDSSPSMANEPVPEFGMSEADAASQAIEISEVMGQEVDFKDHDVRKDPEVNIFDTLHGLYQTKGRQKLQVQPEPAEAPATAP